MTGAEPESREQFIIDTFVQLADTLASDYDVSEFLQFLVERCATILQADTAGVLLETPDGTLRLNAASSDEMAVVDDVELEAGEGPCIEAYRGCCVVVVDDLSEHRDRWPDVVAKLLDIGMRSGHAFPIGLRDDCIGALNLYRRRVGPFGDGDIRLAQSFADAAAIGILQERTVTDAERRAEQLQHALESRIVIEQAKGVLANEHHVTPAAAFEAIRGYARRHRVKVRDVCEQIVAGVTSGPQVFGGTDH